MPFIVVAVIAASGMASFSIVSTLVMLLPTRTIDDQTTLPALSVA
jgi:hypothetical protein